MNEVYWGIYTASPEGLPQPLRDEAVCAPAEVVAVPAGDWVAVGTGWGSYGEALRAAAGVEPRQVEADALPHAEDILRLALPAFAAGQAISGDLLLPVYLRNKVALTLVEQAALRGQPLALAGSWRPIQAEFASLAPDPGSKPVYGGPCRPSATASREPRQARKGATAAVSLGAGVSWYGPPPS